MNDRRYAALLMVLGALLLQRGRRLVEEKREQFFRRERVVDGDFRQRLEQNRRRCRLVQLRQGGQRFVTELTRQALSRQQSEVHRPVPNVTIFALDTAQLVIGQTAELILNRAKRLVEQDPGRRVLDERQKAEGKR